MSKHSQYVVLVAAFAAIWSGAAQAQMSAISSKQSPSRLVRAIQVEERAVALHADPSRAAESARLHLQSASLRDAQDPEAVAAMATAAHLYHYANRPLDARRTMERTAQRALAIGDVEKAAQSYVEAAFFALMSSSQRESERLGRKALLLSTSPLLTNEQRSAITRRIRATPALASIAQ